MESIVEIREALEARSATTSLDDLRTRGKQRVKVIRPEQIAAMIQEAVERTIAGSGLVAPADVQRLVEEARREFQQVGKERAQEVARTQSAARELDAAKSRIAELEAQLGGTGAPAHAGQANPDVIARMMNEMAEMKARLAKSPETRAEPVGSSAGIEAALNKLAGSLEDRLEKFGKKIGISGAVEADAVDYGALFSDHGEKQKIESNLDTMQTSQSKASGIAGNLEKLKKLRRS